MKVEDFHKKNVESWRDLIQVLDGFKDRWMFRGQHSSFGLETSLVRACNDSNIENKDRPLLEREMIREFRRWYDGPDKQDVQTDLRYCLSLMQHFGAPTRMLDFTYSKYVAVYFALESAKNHDYGNNERSCSIWCLNGKWCSAMAKDNAGSKKNIKIRN